jgi:hypothetical protein
VSKDTEDDDENDGSRDPGPEFVGVDDFVAKKGND